MHNDQIDTLLTHLDRLATAAEAIAYSGKLAEEHLLAILDHLEETKDG